MDMPNMEPQKWMWHLWGIAEATCTDLTVIGFHRESETVAQVLQDSWYLDLWDGVNGADAHAPSAVKIQKPGKWTFLLFTDGELFDTLVYEIDK